MRRFRRNACTLVASTALCFVVGCGGEYVPASGVVNVDGAPASGVVLVFHPTAGPQETATARTDEAGRYSLMTRSAGDGARPGEYAVTAVWMEEKPRPASEIVAGDTENVSTSVDRLKGRYAAKDKTAAKATVPADGSEISAIELTTK